LTTKCYRSLSLPFSCFTSGSVSIRKGNPVISGPEASAAGYNFVSKSGETLLSQQLSLLIFSVCNADQDIITDGRTKVKCPKMPCARTSWAIGGLLASLFQIKDLSGRGSCKLCTSTSRWFSVSGGALSISTLMMLMMITIIMIICNFMPIGACKIELQLTEKWDVFLVRHSVEISA